MRADRVAVLVPVMCRPQAAARFMASLQASGAESATVYAVVDRGDDATRVAWEAAGAEIVVSSEADWGLPGQRGGTFAQKVNLGYRCTVEPWLFLTGDDVRFHPGWLNTGLTAAGDRYHVVGTNDLGNPRVVAGEHATHMFIRRSYVDETGASWDGPGVVCHEGYRHWWVDEEIVVAAKRRGVWRPALDAVVEHLHPLWKPDVPVDDVYLLGRSFAGADAALYQRRRRTYAP